MYHVYNGGDYGNTKMIDWSIFDMNETQLTFIIVMCIALILGILLLFGVI